LCCEFLTFSYTAFLTLTNSTKTNNKIFTFFYYLTKHAKTLKNSGAQARAVLASRLAELSNKALRNYNTAVKRAPFFAALALRAHKASTSKVN
jgi:hypothetical protein